MNYLHIAIVVVCFYDVIILLCLPSTVNILFPADRSAAGYIVGLTAITLAGIVMCREGFKALPNKYIALFLGAVFFSAAHCPNVQFESHFVPKDSALYNYKPMFECFLMMMLFMASYSIRITNDQLQRILKTLSIIIGVYGFYIILQRLGLDQFYVMTTGQRLNEMTRHPESGAFMGQPVYAAAFIATILPIAMKQKNIGSIVLGLSGIIFTGNRAALLAVAVSSLYLFSYTRRLATWTFLGLVAMLIGVLTFSFIFPDMAEKIHPSGRLEVWRDIFIDLLHNPFPGITFSHILTGNGIGFFSVLFPFYHHSSFFQAHNEWLEVLAGVGVVGLITMVLAQKHMFQFNGDITLKASLVALCVCALFNPIWHIPQLQFLTAIILGLYYQNINNKGAATCGTQEPI